MYKVQLLWFYQQDKQILVFIKILLFLFIIYMCLTGLRHTFDESSQRLPHQAQCTSFPYICRRVRNRILQETGTFMG